MFKYKIQYKAPTAPVNLSTDYLDIKWNLDSNGALLLTEYDSDHDLARLESSDLHDSPLSRREFPTSSTICSSMLPAFHNYVQKRTERVERRRKQYTDRSLPASSSSAASRSDIASFVQGGSRLTSPRPGRTTQIEHSHQLPDLTAPPQAQVNYANSINMITPEATRDTDKLAEKLISSSITYTSVSLNSLSSLASKKMSRYKGLRRQASRGNVDNLHKETTNSQDSHPFRPRNVADLSSLPIMVPSVPGCRKGNDSIHPSDDFTSFSLGTLLPFDSSKASLSDIDSPQNIETPSPSLSRVSSKTLSKTINLDSGPTNNVQSFQK